MPLGVFAMPWHLFLCIWH